MTIAQYYELEIMILIVPYSANHISDISALSGLTNLEELYLGFGGMMGQVMLHIVYALLQIGDLESPPY